MVATEKAAFVSGNSATVIGIVSTYSSPHRYIMCLPVSSIECDIWRILTVQSNQFCAVQEADAASELAASNKVVLYAGLSSQGEFVPTAVESYCPINRDAL